MHRAMLAGERGAFFADDLALRITRHGGEPEDTFFTLSYSPVPDETARSGVGGVLMTAVETSKSIWVERALRDREAELARVQEVGRSAASRCS